MDLTKRFEANLSVVSVVPVHPGAARSTRGMTAVCMPRS